MASHTLTLTSEEKECLSGREPPGWGGPKVTFPTAGTVSVPGSETIDPTQADPADGIGATLERVSKSTYDVAVDGGAEGDIALGEDIPDDAIIVGGFYEVVTTFTGNGGADDDMTIALKLQTANDLVTAIAISDVTNPWDAGFHPLNVVPDDPTTFIKLTAAREVTAVVDDSDGTNELTAGKLNLYLRWIPGEA